MQYSSLTESNATPRGSINPVDSPVDRIDHLCRTCKSQLSKKQRITHTLNECLSQRCEFLENDVARLKDRDIKSRLLIKELEGKIVKLEEAVQGLTAPKQEQATPYSFGAGHKLRHQFKKAMSEDVPSSKGQVNYDNIIQSNKSPARDRRGLFGSLGAASQER